MEEASSIEIISSMQKIQKKFLNYIEKEDNTEENFQNLKSTFDELKIWDDKPVLQSLLHLFIKIANNHYRGPDFHNKIETILQIFKDSIKKYYSNSEIFNIFKSSKKILLFLIEEQIIIFDEYIVKKIVNNEKYIYANYPEFFQPEIMPFINENWFPKKTHRLNRSNEWIQKIKEDLPENFYEYRKNGENEDPICELIRNNMTKDFITYINKNNVPFDGEIKESIYETNPFLVKTQSRRNISLIEYAIFFGSIEIFNFLRINETKLESSLWKFAIHSQNPEIIHILEDNHVEAKYQKLLIESIKCHHNDIAKYIMNNCMENENDNSQILSNQSLKYYNFLFIKDEYINQSSFYNLCKFDYFELVDTLLKNIEIDINKKVSESNGSCDSNFNWGKKDMEKAAFQIAVEKENIDIINLLLSNEKLNLNAISIEYSNKKGGFANEYYKMHKNPLCTAVEKENIEIVQLLLNNEKIDVNVPFQSYGYCEEEESEGSREEMNEKTALCIAIEKENIKIVQLLLANEKLDVNITRKYDYCRGSNDYGETGWDVVDIPPLCLAVDLKNIEIIKLLINNEKLDVNALCKDGKEMRKGDKITENNIKYRTAFYLAVGKQDIEIINILLGNEKVDINIPLKLGDKTEESAFCEAIKEGNIEIIKLLLNNEKLHINGLNKYLGHYSYNKQTYGDFLAKVMGFTTSNMEEAIEEQTEFFIAVEKGKIEIIQLLLNNENIDPNIPFRTNYYRRGDWIAKMRRTAFYEAVEKENIEIIKLLLNSGKIDINIPFKGKGKINDTIIVEAEKTAFYLAVEKENIEIIKLLLSNEKLDINFGYKCNENVIAGMKSQKVKLEAIQDILYKFDVDLLNEKEKNQTKKKTPLHLAVEKGNISIIELLLTSKSIDVNVKDEQGKMPIDYTTNDIIKKMLT